MKFFKAILAHDGQRVGYVVGDIVFYDDGGVTVTNSHKQACDAATRCGLKLEPVEAKELTKLLFQPLPVAKKQAGKKLYADLAVRDWQSRRIVVEVPEDFDRASFGRWLVEDAFDEHPSDWRHEYDAQSATLVDESEECPPPDAKVDVSLMEKDQCPRSE